MTVNIIVGDALEELRKLPSDSVDMCLTSPPYWGLRDYQVEGQLGLEPTLGEHLDAMVEIFEEVRRILKPTGSLFLNYGDCYATAPNGRSAADTKAEGVDDRTFRDKPFSTVGPVFGDHKRRPPQGKHAYREHANGRVASGGFIKAKDLCMIPNRLAIALQDAGWWVRSEIIWGKTNPMPDSSGAQRPSTAHEKIFWLAKSEDAPVWRARDTGELSFAPDLSERCPLITKPDQLGARWIRIGTYYDANAVMQGRTSDEDANGFGEPGPGKTRGTRSVKMPDGWDTGAGGHGSHHRQGREKGKQLACAETMPSAARSRRSAGFNERWDEQEANHGQVEGRFLRNYEPAALPVWEMGIEPFKDAHFATFPTELAWRAILAGCPVGGTVLDPVGGAGTTGLVADRLQRDAILIELNPEYAAMARQRIDRDRGALLDAMEAA